MSCANKKYVKIPKMRDIACAELIKPIPRPSDLLPRNFEISITLGPKKQAIPTPTMNLRTAICKMFSDKPVTRAQDEERRIPNTANLSAPYLAAMIPAGTWKSPTPIMKLDVTSPSIEILNLRSYAMRKKMDAILNQLTE